MRSLKRCFLIMIGLGMLCTSAPSFAAKIPPLSQEKVELYITRALNDFDLAHDPQWFRAIESQLHHDLKLIEIIQRGIHSYGYLAIAYIIDRVRERIISDLKRGHNTPRQLQLFWDYLNREENYLKGTTDVRERIRQEVRQEAIRQFFKDPNFFQKSCNISDFITQSVYPMLFELLEKTYSEPGVRSRYFLNQLALDPRNDALIKFYLYYTAQVAATAPLKNIDFLSDFFQSYPLGWINYGKIFGYMPILDVLAKSCSTCSESVKDRIYNLPEDAPLAIKTAALASRNGLTGEAALSLNKLAVEAEKILNRQAADPKISLSEHLMKIDKEHKLDFKTDTTDPISKRVQGIMGRILKTYVDLYNGEIGFWLYQRLILENPSLANKLMEQFYKYEFFPQVFNVHLIENYLDIHPFHTPEWNSSLTYAPPLLEYFFERAPENLQQEMEWKLLEAEDSKLMLYTSTFRKIFIDRGEDLKGFPLFWRMMLAQRVEPDIDTKDFLIMLANDTEFKDSLLVYLTMVANESAQNSEILLHALAKEPFLWDVFTVPDFFKIYAKESYAISLLISDLLSNMDKPEFQEKFYALHNDEQFLLARQNLLKQYMIQNAGHSSLDVIEEQVKKLLNDYNDKIMRCAPQRRKILAEQHDSFLLWVEQWVRIKYPNEEISPRIWAKELAVHRSFLKDTGYVTECMDLMRGNVKNIDLNAPYLKN